VRTRIFISAVLFSSTRNIKLSYVVNDIRGGSHSHSSDLLDDADDEHYEQSSTNSNEFKMRKDPLVRSVQRTAKEAVHNVIMIHAPGGASDLVVRAMYYTPKVEDGGDVVIEVEVSVIVMLD
jgi:hypothetical protein